MAFLGTIGCDAERAAAYADEAIALSVEHGLASPDHRARFFRGALLAQNGDPRAGIELMRNAMRGTEGNAERNRRTLYLSHLASAHAGLGQLASKVNPPDVALRFETARASNPDGADTTLMAGTPTSADASPTGTDTLQKAVLVPAE